MIIGIIADSHDNMPAIHKAVALLNEKKAGFVIHAGDFVAPFALRPLEQLRCPWIGVFGNNDGEQKGLTKGSKGKIQPAPYELNLDGWKVVVVHDLECFDTADFVKKGAQLIIHGHTHRPEIKRENGDVLVINPGELGGWLYGKKTLALVDTDKLEASLEEIQT